MPRRIPDYLDAYAGWSAVSSFGAKGGRCERGKDGWNFSGAGFVLL